MLIKREESTDPLDAYVKDYFTKTSFISQSLERFTAQFDFDEHESEEHSTHETKENQVVESKTLPESELEAEYLRDGEVFGAGTNMEMIEHSVPIVLVDNYCQEDENEEDYLYSKLFKIAI
jgi:hypothetical protein